MEFDPANNPLKMAQISAVVSSRLDGSSFIHKVEHPDAHMADAYKQSALDKLFGVK
jgi:hypothetical protein